MNIAIIGGGENCRLLLELLGKGAHSAPYPRVVAVAADSEKRPGAALARSQGAFVTADYRDLLEREDLDLIIDLKGNEDVLEDVLKNRKAHVRVMDSVSAQLLLGFSPLQDMIENTRGELERTKILYDAAMNAFYQEDVMVIGLHYRILDINEAMLKKLGLTRSAAIGMHCYEISHGRDTPCDGREHPCPLKECVDTRQPSQTTHVHRDKDNRKCYYSISCYPVFEDGEVIGAVEISKDITRDINLQKGLVQQQKLASIGHLAAGVAHEINNPLTTILTTAMLIQEELDPEDPNYQELQTISNEALRCRRIVTSLLDFARQRKPMKTLHNINQIVRDSIALTRKQAAFKDVVFEELLTRDLPQVYVDRDQIQQALINLALNATEATDAGGKVVFSSHAVPEEDAVEITVSDTGTGIPENMLDHIFDPFFTTKDSGTGLGLAITHGIIQRHGGSITVVSVPEKGTTFRLRLPVNRGEDNGR
ncbi:MAG: PAS domain-containing protein [Deltaproteobacteria bacterium]|nr:PAS domain-containing protein [Deltaproteobacteria bacterium]